MSQPITLAVTTLAKLGFPQVNNICDAKFIKKIFRENKSDFAIFVSQNADVKDFLNSLETKIDEQNEEIREMIQEYIESIPDEVNKFRNKLKEMKRQKDTKIKEIEKQRIIEEYLREEEAKKKVQELREKMGLKPELTKEKGNKTSTLASASASASASTEGSDEENSDEEIKDKIKYKKTKDKSLSTESHLTFKTGGKTSTSTSTSTPTSTEPSISNQVNSKITNDVVDKEYKVSINLAEFYEFLKVVVKEDILVIKSDKGRLTIRDIDLDESKIRIKVE